MAEHVDGWKDEEGDVNDAKGENEDFPKLSDFDRVRRPTHYPEKHKDATFWFVVENVDDADIQDMIMRIENYLNLLPGSIAVTVSPHDS